MESRSRLKFTDLPSFVKPLIIEADFLRACVALNTSNVIIWMVNKATGGRLEVEWSSAKTRFLSRDERLQDLEKGLEINLPQHGVLAAKSYWLEEITDTLLEKFSLVSLDTGCNLFEICQSAYSPVRRDDVDFIVSELQNKNFPKVYAAWSLDDQVNYWVAALYQLRRHTVENGAGASEDDVFGPKLIEDMKSLDVRIESILPLILKGLAKMELANVNEVINSFNKRTRLSIDA